MDPKVLASALPAECPVVPTLAPSVPKPASPADVYDPFNSEEAQAVAETEAEAGSGAAGEPEAARRALAADEPHGPDGAEDWIDPDGGPELPAWQRVSGLRPGISPEDRRVALKRLASWVDAAYAEMLIRRQELGPDADPVLGVASDPGWEPSYMLAARLGLGETRLNAFLREYDGVSARERWDLQRVQSLAQTFRAELRGMLEGCEPGVKEWNRSIDLIVEELRRILRSERRRLAWTRVNLGLRVGYKNHTRANLAVFRAYGRSLEQLELDWLREIAATWYENRETGRIFSEPEGVIRDREAESARADELMDLAVTLGAQAAGLSPQETQEALAEFRPRDKAQRQAPQLAPQSLPTATIRIPVSASGAAHGQALAPTPVPARVRSTNAAAPFAQDVQEFQPAASGASAEALEADTPRERACGRHGRTTARPASSGGRTEPRSILRPRAAPRCGT